MKAIVFTEYGSPDVLQLKEIAKPIPKENEILVRVRAATINYGDLTTRNFANLTASEFNMPAFLFLPARMSFGWNKPKINILGSELAGDVEAVGSAVKEFKPGEAVFAYGGMTQGADAEYSRHIIRFSALKEVGTTESNWPDFAQSGQYPVSYVIA